MSDFVYGEQDGTGDVYYTISFVEYINTTTGTSNVSSSSSNSTTQRPNENANTDKNKQKVHKVVKGDNLWDIAHKYYGKGSEYTKIKNANSSKYTSLKNSNIIYVGMELIIP